MLLFCWTYLFYSLLPKTKKTTLYKDGLFKATLRIRLEKKNDDDSEERDDKDEKEWVVSPR